MIKKLIAHGNSLALILDKPLLQILNIDKDTPLKLQINGDSLIITQVKEKIDVRKITENEKHQKALEDIINRYNSLLKKLADN